MGKLHKMNWFIVNANDWSFRLQKELSNLTVWRSVRRHSSAGDCRMKISGNCGFALKFLSLLRTLQTLKFRNLKAIKFVSHDWSGFIPSSVGENILSKFETPFSLSLRSSQTHSKTYTCSMITHSVHSILTRTISLSEQFYSFSHCSSYTVEMHRPGK